jgi:anti-sigma B factor antagonist
LLLEPEGAAVISAGLSAREDGGHLIVTLRGELDVVDAASVAAALAAAAARNPRIIIDLAGLEFIDCAGLRVLARAREQARQCGGDLLLAAPRSRVRRILALTSLAGVFSVHASLAGAAQTAGRCGPDPAQRDPAAPAQPLRHGPAPGSEPRSGAHYLPVDE